MGTRTLATRHARRHSPDGQHGDTRHTASTGTFARRHARGHSPHGQHGDARHTASTETLATRPARGHSPHSTHGDNATPYARGDPLRGKRRAAAFDAFCPSRRPPGAANSACVPGERGAEEQPERKPARPASAY